ncbi:hypothetical protein P4S83_08925 [Aneurinibacillus thermoaerophilus]|uniref:protein kinase domain-containing protein n=1 Tax=Aneurinibacillus thermoaerophilus TaxID=143495 RepID=UPI002E22A9FB|nr:hypothetical protein [Aneurinibacillus thermoaerophilus]MED0763743.1 hypothetical protein [Aneurinibacillus thermoaerophilus]
MIGIEEPDVEGGCRFVLEDPGGVPLRTFWNTRPLSLDDFFLLALSLTDLLERLHGFGIVHLDFRPDHLLIEPSTLAAHLIDFRLAVRLDGADGADGADSPPRTEAEGAEWTEEKREEPKGPPDEGETLPYRAPELFLRSPADHRADLFSLGVILYEALTGRLPYEAKRPGEWRHAHLARRPVDPRLWTPNFPRPCARCWTA